MEIYRYFWYVDESEVWGKELKCYWLAVDVNSRVALTLSSDTIPVGNRNFRAISLHKGHEHRHILQHYGVAFEDRLD